MNLNVRTELDAHVAAIVVEGEVDVSNADAVRTAIDEALAREEVASVVADLAAVPYIDSTGIGVLVGSAHKARDAGKAFSVLNPQDNVIRILGMLGVDEVIDINSSQQR